MCVRLPSEPLHEHVHIFYRLRLQNGHPFFEYTEPTLKVRFSPPVVHTRGNTHNTHNTCHQVSNATLVVHGGSCRFQFGGGSLSRGIWIHHPSRLPYSNIEEYTWGTSPRSARSRQKTVGKHRNSVTESTERNRTQPCSYDDRNTIALGEASDKARLSFRNDSDASVGRSTANLIIVLKILAGATCQHRWMQMDKYRNLVLFW